MSIQKKILDKLSRSSSRERENQSEEEGIEPGNMLNTDEILDNHGVQGRSSSSMSEFGQGNSFLDEKNKDPDLIKAAMEADQQNPNLKLKMHLLNLMTAEDPKMINNTADLFFNQIRKLIHLESQPSMERMLCFNFRFTPSPQAGSRMTLSHLIQDLTGITYSGRKDEDLISFLFSVEEKIRPYSFKISGEQAAHIFCNITFGNAKDTLRSAKNNINSMANRLIQAYSDVKSAHAALKRAQNYRLTGSFYSSIHKPLGYIRLYGDCEPDLEIRTKLYNTLSNDVILSNIPYSIKEKAEQVFHELSSTDPHEILDYLGRFSEQLDAHVRRKNQQYDSLHVKQISMSDKELNSDNNSGSNSENVEKVQDIHWKKQDIPRNRPNARHFSNNRGNSGGSAPPRNFPKKCTHCRKEGHVRENCYKLMTCAICSLIGHHERYCNRRRCILCNSKLHNAVACNIYQGSVNPPVEHPCALCESLFGSKLYHKPSACIYRNVNPQIEPKN